MIKYFFFTSLSHTFDNRFPFKWRFLFCMLLVVLEWIERRKKGETKSSLPTLFAYTMSFDIYVILIPFIYCLKGNENEIYWIYFFILFVMQTKHNKKFFFSVRILCLKQCTKKCCERRFTNIMNSKRVFLVRDFFRRLFSSIKALLIF